MILSGVHFEAQFFFGPEAKKVETDMTSLPFCGKELVIPA